MSKKLILFDAANYGYYTSNSIKHVHLYREHVLLSNRLATKLLIVLLAVLKTKTTRNCRHVSIQIGRSRKRR